MRPARVAVVQAASVMFDSAGSMEKLGALAAVAATAGAELVVFPEAFIAGYPKGLDFGARIGSRTAKGRDDFVRYFNSAITVPGPEVCQMEKLAADLNIVLVVGVIERAGSTLHCCVVFVSPQGLLGKHRKLMPTAAERLVWGYGDGSTMPVFDLPMGKTGAVICWENYMPLMRMAMYGKGIELYCAPTADDRDTWVPTMQHVAMEGACHVLSACQILTRTDCPEDYDAVVAPDGPAAMMRGGSCIVDPFGRLLAGPVFNEEVVLYAEIDPAQVVRRKYEFDVAGHYARPDVFSLTVSGAQRSPVNYQP